MLIAGMNTGSLLSKDFASSRKLGYSKETEGAASFLAFYDSSKRKTNFSTTGIHTGAIEAGVREVGAIGAGAILQTGASVGRAPTWFTLERLDS
jgi:hypothetical protein